MTKPFGTARVEAAAPPVGCFAPFLSQDRQRDVLAPEFAMDHCPIGLGIASHALFRAGAAVELVLQKPVFYTCEKSKFGAARTHFDTEHLQTILWDAADPVVAAEELKACIRNEFPADSIPPDLSKRGKTG